MTGKKTFMTVLTELSLFNKKADLTKSFYSIFNFFNSFA